MVCKRGELYMVRLSADEDGSLQEGIRPILIISNDKCNEHSPVISVVPLTTKMNKHRLPTHVLIEGCGLKRKSLVLAEQIISINKTKLERYIGSIKESVYEKRVDQAIRIQLNV